MRYVFKTSYDADIRLFKHRAQAVWYGLLLLLVLGTPLYFVAIGDAYLLGEITGVLILAIAGMGLMLLTGHTGLPSLGHATFMALGCYVNINLLGAGVPWVIAFPLSGLIAGLVGTLIALPVLRLHGVYLALATLAMSILTSDFVVMAEPWTGGIAGAAVPDINLFGIEINRYATPYKFYYLVLFVAILLVWFYRNLLRTPTGRSFTAIRDSEISARAMGINLTRTKATSFFLSATAAGLAGALFGHSAGYVTNETFDLVMSITLLLMIVIGGLGFIHGAFFGAIVIGIIPVAIANGRSFLATTFDINVNVPGLESALFAFILVCFILFEPMGRYGRWLKIRTYFELFPFYRKDMFKRQKSYLKTDRVQ